MSYKEPKMSDCICPDASVNSILLPTCPWHGKSDDQPPASEQVSRTRNVEQGSDSLTRLPAPSPPSPQAASEQIKPSEETLQPSRKYCLDHGEYIQEACPYQRDAAWEARLREIEKEIARLRNATTYEADGATYILQPTYFVKRPDESFSVADPQPSIYAAHWDDGKGIVTQEDWNKQVGAYEEVWEHRNELDLKLAAAEQEKNAAVAAWRQLLWLNHARYLPETHMPYGDDGEMQCCGIDFKRDSADVVTEKLSRRPRAPA